MKLLFTFSSNSVRLSSKGWIAALAILVLIFSLLPVLWKGLENFDPSDDYRIPYELSNDYWMFSRWCKYASSNYQILMIGDSVIWGQYVNMQETLPYYLQLFYTGSVKTLTKKNSKRERRFANLGLDGIHPAAMYGLIRYYGRPISNKKVILHLNLLWMSSKKHELSDTDEFRFNHPRLVPQFYPRIPSYRAKFSQRFSIAIGRNPFSSWTDHIRQNYYENMDISNWTTQYPYTNPFSAISFQIPLPENVSHSEPISWMERGMTKQDFPWISIDESFQWDSFKKAIKLLQARKNKVFVIIGPFNPYILTDESLKRYNAMKKGIETQLRDEGISYASISDLPGEYYADASHPLKDGYAAIARELINSGFLRKSLMGE